MSSSTHLYDSQASEPPKKKRLLTGPSIPKMATTKNVEPATKKVIDPDGDLILVLTDAELQVSSKFLCMTSKVFKTMLSPKFAEGNTNLVEGVRHVDIPGQWYLSCLSPPAYNLNPESV